MSAAQDKRIAELEARCAGLDRRLAAMEGAMQAQLERRARLVPPEFDSPEVQELFRRQCVNAVTGAQNDSTRREADGLVIFERARAQAMQRMANAEIEADAALAAEVCAAIAFYQEHGHAPAGYTVIDPPATQ